MGYLNPLLDLPSTKRLLALDAPVRQHVAAVLEDLRQEANQKAETNWRRRKGIIAAYWRAVSTYARHFANALRRGAPGLAPHASGKGTTMTMQMAKATPNDLDMAMELCGALDALRGGVLPEAVAASDDDASNEYESARHAERVLDYLLGLTERASLSRVCFGMATLLDPRNQVVDPDAAVLAEHPRHVRAAATLATVAATLQDVHRQAVAIGEAGDSIAATISGLAAQVSEGQEPSGIGITAGAVPPVHAKPDAGSTVGSDWAGTVAHAGELLIRTAAVLGTLSADQQDVLRRATDGGLPDAVVLALRSAKEVSPQIRRSLTRHPPVGLANVEL